MESTQEQVLQHYPRCYGCGAANEGGLRLDVRWDGREAFAEHVPPEHSEGGPGVAHGGYVGAIVDEVMALVAAEHAEAPAMTRRVELDLRAPVLIGRPVHIRAWVDRTGKRSIVVRLEATSPEGGHTCFEAMGVFIRVPREAWLKPMQSQDRGPERIDWSGGDPSTFLRWQMKGGLEKMFCAERLSRPLRIAVDIEDARPGDWTIVAGDDGVTAEPERAEACDARFGGTFQRWQELIRSAVPLDSLVADGAVRVEGDPQALVEFAEALDFRRYA